MTLLISVINESTAISDADVQAMIPAFRTQWNRDLATAWLLEAAAFTDVIPLASASGWQVVFLDDSDQASALAYHDVTAAGMPIAKVFVKTILADGASVSVGATHEICEMAVDPTINIAAQDSGGVFWAYEVCDPVEDDQYGYDIGGVLVSDFILPSWYNYQSNQAPFDMQHHCSAPFQVLTAGYAQKFGPQGWTQVNGDSVVKAKALRPPSGSRRDRRANRTGKS